MSQETFLYSTTSGKLKIELDPTKNLAPVYFDNVLLFTFDNHADLAKGKELNNTPAGTLFIKLINLHEGFTVMQNGKHLRESAGHPVQLLQRTIKPLLLGLLALVARLALILYILFDKGELQNFSVNLKVASYVLYTPFLMLLLLLAVLLSKKGKWVSPLLGGFIILSDLIFNTVALFYYGTGITYADWAITAAEFLVIVQIAGHYKIISYVKSYTLGLKK